MEFELIAEFQWIFAKSLNFLIHQKSVGSAIIYAKRCNLTSGKRWEAEEGWDEKKFVFNSQVR